MNDRNFNKTIRAISPKGALSVVKAKALPSETRDALSKYIIRNRGPVATALLPDNPDLSWMAACGYMYRSKSAKTGMEFIHTCEHTIH